MALIQTTLGLIEETELEFKTGIHENDNEKLTWVEYWKNDELVHRSVDMYLKTGIDFGLETQQI